MTYALTTQSIVIIHGSSGVGKTTALREFQRNNNNVWVITTSPSRATMTECMYELAMELGMENAPACVARWPAPCAAACSTPKA